LDSKGYEISLNWIQKPSSDMNPNLSWNNDETGSNSTLTEEDLSFLSWFLSNDVQFTAKDAE